MPIVALFFFSEFSTRVCLADLTVRWRYFMSSEEVLIPYFSFSPLIYMFFLNVVPLLFYSLFFFLSEYRGLPGG